MTPSEYEATHVLQIKSPEILKISGPKVSSTY